MFRLNEGMADRTVRVLAGLTVLSLGWFGVVEGTLGVAFRVLGFVPLLTGLVGWCPVYAVFGISTCRVKATE